MASRSEDSKSGELGSKSSELGNEGSEDSERYNNVLKRFFLFNHTHIQPMSTMAAYSLTCRPAPVREAPKSGLGGSVPHIFYFIQLFNSVREFRKRNVFRQTK